MREHVGGDHVPHANQEGIIIGHKLKLTFHNLVGTMREHVVVVHVPKSGEIYGVREHMAGDHVPTSGGNYQRARDEAHVP
jgi:hypothetical protein